MRDTLAELLREKRVSQSEWDGMLRAGRIFATKAYYRQPPGYGVQLEDLEQSARIGIWMALQRFDPDRGLKFSTYAWDYARGYVAREYRDWNHVPHSQEEAIAKGKRERRPSEHRPLSLDALAEDLDASPFALLQPIEAVEPELELVPSDAVDELPEPLRRTVRLFLESGDVSAIARQEQRTRAAIYGRLKHAGRLLRETLQGRV